ncbi:hypothetical protein ABBQ38_003054 [Trebouxia sp. C0009 RCD-2024]
MLCTLVAVVRLLLVRSSWLNGSVRQKRSHLEFSSAELPVLTNRSQSGRNCFKATFDFTTEYCQGSAKLKRPNQEQRTDWELQKQARTILCQKGCTGCHDLEMQYETREGYS